MFMNNEEKGLQVFHTGKVSQLHLIAILLNLAIPLVVDQFAIVRNLLARNIILTAINPDIFEINPTYNYTISMILSIIFVGIYIIVGIVLSFIKTFDLNFLNVTAYLSAIFYLLFFLVFLFPPLGGWQLYVLFVAYIGRYFLAVGGLLYLILLLRQSKRELEEFLETD